MILNLRQAGYNQDFRDQIQRLLALKHSDVWLNRHGGIFMLHAGQLNDDDRFLLEAAARVILDTCAAVPCATDWPGGAIRRAASPARAVAALCARAAHRVEG